MDPEISENTAKSQGIDRRLWLIFPSSFPDSAVDMLCFSSPTCEISGIFSCQAFQVLMKLLFHQEDKL